jgi:hypothetical protein
LAPDAPETSEVERMIEAGDALAAPIVRAAIAKGLSFKRPAGIGRVSDQAKDHVALMLADAYRHATGKEPTRGNCNDRGRGSLFQDFVVMALGDLTPGGLGGATDDAWGKRWERAAARREAEIEEATRKLAAKRPKFTP